MRGRRTEEIQPEEEIQPVLRQDTQGTLKEGRPSRLEPLSHPGVPPRQENPISSIFVGNLLPNQVNLEKDISRRVKNAMDGIKKDPKIISDPVKLLEHIKNSSKNEVPTTNKTHGANDRVKMDLTIAIIKEYPEIITKLADSKSLSEFIKGLEIESSLYLKKLVKTIITDFKDSKALINIIGLTNSKELLEFIKDLNIKDDLDNLRNTIDLIKTIIKDKSGIISDLKISTDPADLKSLSLSGFIKDLGIETKHDKTDLVIAVISSYPGILGGESDKEKNLSVIIKNINIDYKPLLIIKILKTLPQELNISFRKLNDNLYPKSDYLKKSLIIEAIKQKVLDKINFLKCGFNDIKEGGFHLKILEEAKYNGIDVADKDLFNYLELPNYYESLKSGLNDKKVKEIIREEAIPNIANFIYGDNPTSKDIKGLREKKATSLISYFDFINDVVIVTSALIKGVGEEILKSSIEKTIEPKKLSTRDVKKIAILFGMNPKDVRTLMEKKENDGARSGSDLNTLASSSAAGRHPASPSQLVADSIAQDSSSRNYPVVTVPNTPSNSPNPGGCFQAFLKCFGVGR
jgi:hypothetical protein